MSWLTVHACLKKLVYGINTFKRAQNIAENICGRSKYEFGITETVSNVQGTNERGTNKLLRDSQDLKSPWTGQEKVKTESKVDTF